jgi:plastocyanin
MGRLLALGILGALASQKVRVPTVRTVRTVPMGGILVAMLLASSASAQTGLLTGTITTAAKGVAPVRVTIDQKVCGDELPDEAIIVDAQGRLANAVVILSGVKRAAATDATVMNEKCRFAPRVQVIAPKASVTTTSRDAVLHTTNAQLENGRSLFNVALPIPGITITRAISSAGNVRLSCNTHPWMRGWMVVTSEAAAISGADGRFTIDNVPPGTYELRVWHEALKGAPQKVTVSAGKPTDVSIQLK